MKPLNDADFEKFNLFIFSVDDSVDEIQQLAKDKGIKLSFSAETPKSIEDLIIAIDLNAKDNHMINVLAQYIGEYFRKTIGGKWHLGDDPESSMTYNCPVISGHNSVGHVFDPIMTIRNFVIRRKQGIIATAIEAEKGVDDLNLIPEE
jgi:hypothetical protein